MARESPLNDFGSYIAYLIPGATLLVGLSPFSATLRSWFATAPADVPTIGGFLYLTMASLAGGMTINALRWIIVDTLHGHMGLRLPDLDFGQLGRNVDAFEVLIRIHYAHYQFYANMFIATAIAFLFYGSAEGFSTYPLSVDAGFVGLEAVFFATSRDTLRKYYTRSRQLLAAEKR